MSLSMLVTFRLPFLVRFPSNSCFIRRFPFFLLRISFLPSTTMCQPKMFSWKIRQDKLVRSELRSLPRRTSLPTRFGKFNMGIASRTKIIYILTNFGPNDTIRKTTCSCRQDRSMYVIKINFLNRWSKF